MVLKCEKENTHCRKKVNRMGKWERMSYKSVHKKEMVSDGVLVLGNDYLF